MASQPCDKCGIDVDPDIQDKCPNCGRKIKPISQAGWDEPAPLDSFDESFDDLDSSPEAIPPPPGYDAPPPPYLPPPPPPGQVPEKRSGGFLRNIGVRVALGLLIFGGFSAWSAISSADRDDSGVIVEEGDVAANELAVGDCLFDPGEDVFEEVRGVACDEPHDFEIFSLATISGTSYPTDLAFDDAAFQHCLPAFEAYTGENYDASDYWIGYFVPDERAWSDGDRIMQCYLHLPGQMVTGSQSR